MKRRSLLFCLALLSAASILLAANGSKGKRVVYEATVPIANATTPDCHFLVELEPILFQIDSVQNKYRVIRINIKNSSQSPLKLSLEKDSVQVRTGSRVVQGRLNLADSDQSWWDGLSPELRRALAYPDQSVIKGGEEENVFAYFPVADLPTPPTEILFKIEAVSTSPVVMRQRGAAAAKAD
jgi:hypothetical protein